MSNYGIDVTTKVITTQVPAALGATANDVYVIIPLAHVAGEVRKAVVTAMTTLAAGDGSNNRIINISKGTAPTFGTVMGTVTNNGQAFTADTPVAFVMGAAAARRFAAGESVAFSTAYTGTGGALAVGDKLSAFVVFGEYDNATP